MVTRDSSWLQPARDSSFGMEDFVGRCIGHGRNKVAHGGMGRSSSPREEVLFLFSFTSLVFHTCSALETQSERKSVDAPFGSFTSLD